MSVVRRSFSRRHGPLWAGRVCGSRRRLWPLRVPSVLTCRQAIGRCGCATRVADRHPSPAGGHGFDPVPPIRFQALIDSTSNPYAQNTEKSHPARDRKTWTDVYGTLPIAVTHHGKCGSRCAIPARVLRLSISNSDDFGLDPAISCKRRIARGAQEGRDTKVPLWLATARD